MEKMNEQAKNLAKMIYDKSIENKEEISVDKCRKIAKMIVLKSYKEI